MTNWVVFLLFLLWWAVWITLMANEAWQAIKKRRPLWILARLRRPTPSSRSRSLYRDTRNARNLSSLSARKPRR